MTSYIPLFFKSNDLAVREIFNVNVITILLFEKFPTNQYLRYDGPDSNRYVEVKRSCNILGAPVKDFKEFVQTGMCRFIILPDTFLLTYNGLLYDPQSCSFVSLHDDFFDQQVYPYLKERGKCAKAEHSVQLHASLVTP